MNSIFPTSQLARCKGRGFFRMFARVLACIAPMVAVQVANAAETVTYYYSDHQGTVLATANASGAVTSTSDYRPYGTQTLGSPSDGPGYTGHVNDVDSSLVYMQARYYDPATGAFLSTDPTSVSAGNFYNFGRYAYASNNPIANIDPDGRDTVGENIDQNAQAAADSGNHVATFAWAFAGAAWEVFGAEPVSQVVDKGSGASHADMAMAAIAVVTLGKGEEAAAIGKEVVEVGEDVAKNLEKVSTLKPGPFAEESIPGHMGSPTASEQAQVNGLMEKNGCHTCGTKNPGTKSGNAVVDHQPPKRLGKTTDFYPHCVTCMRRQGGEVTQQLRQQR